MKSDSRLTPLAASLPATVPFVGPEAQERGRGKPFAARLGANESVFGPSPKAVEAMQAAASEAWMYGDSESHDLREALAAYHDIDAAHISIGEGIDGLLGNLVRLYVTPLDVVVTSRGAYPTFNYHVAGFGGQLRTVPYAGDYEDPERLMAKAKELGAKLIYIANPDNPMGTWHSGETIERMVQAVPEDALLVLDEAYADFMPKDAMPWISPGDPRVIRLRTFSKAYGLAGARIGYAVGAAKVIEGFNKVRNHFGVNRVAQAGALAALQDQEYLEEVRSHVARSRDRIAEIASNNALKTVKSATNFVAIDCGSDGDFARRVLNELIERDVFVRMPGVAPLDRCIRVSCGRDEDMDLLAKALPQALAAARKG